MRMKDVSADSPSALLKCGIAFFFFFLRDNKGMDLRLDGESGGDDLESALSSDLR